MILLGLHKVTFAAKKNVETLGMYGSHFKFCLYIGNIYGIIESAIKCPVICNVSPYFTFFPVDLKAYFIIVKKTLKIKQP